ncbi:hypothetical protein EKO27_g9509 [Xylaria grammica]|uniref:Uncharacterized protein n=1 Tax=Xylaria grammica TaxID=363999 RepID=A0A439CTW4_9PEZI|nr:hypothetical protein EKO27_g9509 [Xylaria grammica]
MAPPERRSTASLETPLEDPSALPPPSEVPSDALLALPSSIEAPSTLPLSSETPLEDPATLPSSPETSAPTSRCYPELMAFKRHVTSKYIKLQGSERDFLPINLQKELVTRDSVLLAFKAIGETESAELDHIVDFVLRKGERIFLILVLMTYNNAEKLSALRELKIAGVDDDKLPLELSNKELLDRMPKGWEDNDFELFQVHQWPLLAPILERESVYDVHELQPLPYVELPSTPKGEGFFGEVSRAEIHEAHIIEKHRPAENARANNRPSGIAVAIKKAKDSQESKDFKEPPFANLPGLPADLKCPDTEIRDQRNKYTRPAYKGGMLSPGDTRGPVQALPNSHNQPIGQVDNLEGDFAPEVVVDPPGDTAGPALPATTGSTVADEREVAESATMNNQEYVSSSASKCDL